MNLVRSGRRNRQVADGQRRDGKGCALRGGGWRCLHHHVATPTEGVRLAFGAGIGGSTIVDRIVFMWLYYFWVRGAVEGGQAYVPPVLFGVIVFGGRVLDAVTDPVVARWSDNHRGRLGRRRPFLLGSGLPYVVAGAVLFFPPVRGPSTVNVVYLVVGLADFSMVNCGVASTSARTRRCSVSSGPSVSIADCAGSTTSATSRTEGVTRHRTADAQPIRVVR